MKASVKRFQLKEPMTNYEIAGRLGVTHGNSRGVMGVFYVHGMWVGSKVNEKTFTLAINRTDLHKKALGFATLAGES